jgi:hypothetical protein
MLHTLYRRGAGLLKESRAKPCWSIGRNNGNRRTRMADSEKLPEGSAPPLTTAEELREVWGRFRAGGTVKCPRDGEPLALAVDASAGVYRLVCTTCGVASAWFEAGPDGVRVRGGVPPSRTEG